MTSTLYDVLGRVRQTSTGGMTTTYEYYDTGLVKSQSDGSLTITNTYDALGRLIGQTETGGVSKDYIYGCFLSR